MTNVAVTQAQTELTVAICTHNRATDVAECLSALAHQMRGHRVRVMVVDSGSREEIRGVLVDLVSRYPFAELIRVDQPGLSLARNTACEASQSDWIAFLDDDAVPDDDWLEQAVRLARNVPQNCAVIGGEVRALLPNGSRERFGRRWAQLLSLASQTGEMDTTHAPAVCGANVMFRRTAIAAVGGFPLSLGRRGTQLISGEEKLVQERLTERGWRVWGTNQLCVGHKISTDRLSLRWVARRAYWDGISDERIRVMLGRELDQRLAVSVALRTPLLGLLCPFSVYDHEFMIRFFYNVGFLSELRRTSLRLQAA